MPARNLLKLYQWTRFMYIVLGTASAIMFLSGFIHVPLVGDVIINSVLYGLLVAYFSVGCWKMQKNISKLKARIKKQ